MRVYVIYDKLAQQAGNIFEAINDAVAQRSFLGMCNQPNVDRNEYQLIHLGEFNKDTLKFTVVDNIDITPVGSDRT